MAKAHVIPPIKRAIQRPFFAAAALSFAALLGVAETHADPFKTVSSLRQNPIITTQDFVFHPSGDAYYQLGLALRGASGIAAMHRGSRGFWQMGELTPPLRVEGSSYRPEGLVLDESARFLYVLGDYLDRKSAISVFSIDQESLELEQIQTLSGSAGYGNPAITLGDPMGIALSPDGSRLLVATRHRLWVFSVAESGELTFFRLYDFTFDDGWQVVPKPGGSLLFDSSSDRLYTLGWETITSYSWHSGLGELTRIGSPQLVSELAPGEPRTFHNLVLGPDGKIAYGALPNGSVAVLTREDEGLWQAGGSFDSSLLLKEATLAVSFDQSKLWLRGAPAVGFNGRLTIAQFTIDPSGLILEETQTLVSQSCCDASKGLIGTSPDGSRLWVSRWGRRAGGFIDISGPEMRITEEQENIEGLREIRDITETADGRHIYVAAYESSGVTLLERVGETLEQKASYLERYLGQPSLNSTVRVVLSPDERYLYSHRSSLSSSPLNTIIATFARNLETGELTFIEDLRVPGDSLTLSPDGRHVYMTGDGLQLYERDPVTGHLERIRDADRFGGGTSPGVFDASGEQLYMVAGDLYLWSRDIVSGYLADPSDLDALRNNPFYLESSPDRRFFFVVSSTSHSGHGAIDVVERSVDGRFHNFVQEFRLDDQPILEAIWIDQVAVDAAGPRLFYGSRIGVGILEWDSESGRLSAKAGNERIVGTSARVVKSTQTGSEILVAFPDIGRLEWLRPQCSADIGPCLQQGRFQLEVEWRDANGNVDRATEVAGSADDSKLLWFFNPENWEMLVKVLDGCDINDHYWLFSSAATDVEHTITLTDVATGRRARHIKPAGSRAPAIVDTEALAVCP